MTNRSRHVLLCSLSLFLAGVVLAESAPKPEDYADYNKYLDAMFRFKKQQMSSSQIHTCEDQNKKENQEKKAQDFCKQPEDNTEFNALLEAADKDGKATTSNEHSEAASNTSEAPPDSPRFNPDGTENLNYHIGKIKRSLNAEIDSTDLSNSVGGLNPLTAQALDQERITGGIVSSAIPFWILNNQAMNNLVDVSQIKMQLSDTEQNSLLFNQNQKISVDSLLNLFSKITASQTVDFGYGTGTFSSTSSYTAEGGLSTSVNADVVANLYMVDQDGLPGRLANAGAFMIDQVGIRIQGMNVNLHGDTSIVNNGRLVVKAQSSNPVEIDLSNTKIGVASVAADAPRSTWVARKYIGEPLYFVRFGANSKLTLPSVDVLAVLTSDISPTTPFLTLNGQIGTISLNDIDISTNSTKTAFGTNGIRISRFTLSGLSLVNTKAYINNDKITLDMGTGLSNVGIALRGVTIGEFSSAKPIGDIVIDHINVNSGSVTLSSH